jgi:D-sedoheptulose 7-phosphate isomerase
MKDLIRKQFEEAREVLDQFIAGENSFESIEQAGQVLTDAFKAGKKVISCGNGGSMCDAMHFAEELSGRFRNDRPPLPAISISDASYLSCVANDYGYSQVFSRFVDAMGQSGDILFAISTSGQSENVILAVELARLKGMKVIGLTGKNGGKLASMCDVEIRAPNSQFADRAQEIHIKIIHSLILTVEHNLFEK